jgi:SPP1 family predicted phage head-tail adaptor
MRAGQLRKRLAIYNPMRADDGFGQSIETPALQGTYWGAVRPLRGTEAARIRQVHAEATHLITFRGRIAITPKSTIVLGSRTFHVIEAVNLSERGIETQVTAQELITGG